MRDYYEILGVSPNSEAEVIAAAYRAMMRKYHPDISSDPKSADKARAINEAYEVLRSPLSRRNYDSKRKMRESFHSSASNEKPPPPPPPPPPTPPPPPPRHHSPSAQELHDQAAAKIKNYDRIALAVVLGFVVIGLFSMTLEGGPLASNPEEQVEAEALVLPQASPVPQATAERAREVSEDGTDPSFKLATLDEGDWQNLGPGCACTFSVGGLDENKLIAGGDGMTFFRLNGEAHLCAAPDTQAMFDGAVSFPCGSTAVKITPYGKVEPGFDGHSSKARLSLTNLSGDLSLTGTWGCYC